MARARAVLLVIMAVGTLSEVCRGSERKGKSVKLSLFLCRLCVQPPRKAYVAQQGTLNKMMTGSVGGCV